MIKFNRRKVVLMCADIFIIFVAALMSNLMITIVHGQVFENSRLMAAGVANAALCFMALWICGTYGKAWRYFNIRDYFSCVYGVVTGCAVYTAVCYIGNRPEILQFQIFTAIIACMGIILFRLLFRRAFLAVRTHSQDEKRLRLMIVGAGQAAKFLLEEIHQGKQNDAKALSEYFPVCIVDDDYTRRVDKIKGIPVLGTTNDIPNLCVQQKIDVIIFAIPSCDDKNSKRIIDLCASTKLPVKKIPYLGQLLLSDDLKSNSLLRQVSDIRPEDLLGRPPISFDCEDTRRLVQDKICMITGGGGSIGSELSRQIAKYRPKQLIIVDIYENNAYDIQQELVMEYGDTLDLVVLIASVRDYHRMNQVFDKYRPQLVFHAAAHKHVPMMEGSPAEAIKNNIVGTFNIATLADFYGIEKFVMISTDKAVNPTNVMGASKRCCEMIIQYMAQNPTKTQFVTTRFGNVLGSNGSVIPLFKRQIESGRPVTVTHPDIIRYFMTIPEAVSLVLQAGAMASGGEIYVLDMGAPVKITTLAENLIRMYGKVPYQDVEIKFTGLRPGEKLFEELLMKEEGLKATSNEKIFIGNQIPIQPDTFLKKLEKLKQLSNQDEEEKVITYLADVVPTFHHKPLQNQKQSMVDAQKAAAPAAANAAETAANIQKAKIPAPAEALDDRDTALVS